ncbi:MAG: outer membrane protein assembly factor BamE [Polaromonas sp.]|nr:outer membrane protein assembly factor BamE [Polaromonas sp.]
MFHHIVTYPTMSAKQRNSISSIKPSGLAFLACLAAMGSAGCSSLNTSFNASAANPVNWITPYKIDVIQGNFISKEQVESLKVGMSRAQVKDVLGTPLVTSLFHTDRWDYVFTLKRQGIESQSFKYTLFFKGDQLERFKGDTMPSNEEFIASLANSRKIGKIPVLEATPEQLKAAERPSASAASANASNTAATAPAGTQPATYPPLDSAKP